MAQKKTASNRFHIQPLGELYHDALTIEAWLKGRTLAAEGNSLLCSTLMRRQDYRDKALEELAEKRGITPEQLKRQILTGEAIALTAEDYKAIVSSEDG